MACKRGEERSERHKVRADAASLYTAIYHLNSPCGLAVDATGRGESVFFDVGDEVAWMGNREAPGVTLLLMGVLTPPSVLVDRLEWERLLDMVTLQGRLSLLIQLPFAPRAKDRRRAGVRQQRRRPPFGST